MHVPSNSRSSWKSLGHVSSPPGLSYWKSNVLSKPRYRQAAVQLLTALEADPNVDIVPLSEALYARALQLYRERPDKEWGLTDCVSFLVMQDRGLIEALSTDEHFQQAGFRALLREESS
jgi:hypothetical protein